jgi:hypothetical protein
MANVVYREGGMGTVGQLKPQTEGISQKVSHREIAYPILYGCAAQHKDQTVRPQDEFLSAALDDPSAFLGSKFSNE